MKLVIVASHPVQYYAPIFREVSLHADVLVLYAHNPTERDQGAAGYGVSFSWDVDLLSGYRHKFLRNTARVRSTQTFYGCDTPGIGREIARERPDAVLLMGWYLKTFWQALFAAKRLRVP